MSIRIENRPVISAGHLKTPMLLSTKVVDGFTYFRLSKSDQQITRLLVKEKFSPTDRPLSRSDVIERLVMLRNSAYHSLLMERPDDTEEKEDLGLDAPPKKPRKPSEVDMPASIVAEVPDVEGVEGVSMRMLLSNPKLPLWVELTVANLDFLIEVVNRQIASGVIKRVHPRDAVGEDERVQLGSEHAGVSYSYKRSSIRARAQFDGRTATKYFKVQKPEDVDDAVKEAEAWATGLRQ